MGYLIDKNAKNVWVRDHADTEDLSVIPNANSVYFNNGRTMEQEFGKGTMVSNIVTVDSPMEKVVEGTYDGAYESCKMYGRSLVNLMTNCKDEYVVRYHNPSDPNHTVANISMMKPNTEYTLFCKAKYRTEGDGSGTSGSLKIATYIEQGFNIYTAQSFTTEYKQYVYSFTTSSVVDCFVFSSTDKYFAIKECVLLEGDYTNQDVPFFEGLCDVKMPILKNIGKNLFDGKLELGGINHNTGALATSKTTKRNVDYITVKPNTQLSFSVNSGESGINWFFYDMNENYISNTFARTVTSPPNAHYLRFYNLVGDIPLNDYQIMIAESTAPVTYEPYKTSILTTPEEVVLRKVGDVCDSYDALTGEYMQRIGEGVFNGGENWLLEDFVHDTLIEFKLTSDYRVKSDNSLICDSFAPTLQNNVERIYMLANGGVYVRILKSKVASVGDFKQYLQSNPITVHYELETPITTIIEPSTIPFVYENGHIILESGYEGQSLLPTLEYSTVINRTGQIQSIANTVQKQEKQITKLEQMLIQNIVDLDYNNTLLTLDLEINEVI